MRASYVGCEALRIMREDDTTVVKRGARVQSPKSKV